MEARPFILHRIEDPSGISGTGLVAHGMRHADGTTVTISQTAMLHLQGARCR